MWLAWRRPNRQRLAWRLVASAVAVISLMLLVFPPTYQQSINPATAILLTDGYNSDTLNTLLQKLQPKPQVYTYQTTAKNAEPVTDLYTFRQRQPQVQAVHVLGYGLDEQDLNALDSLNLIAHQSALPAGVNAVTWPASVKLGEAVTVAGKFNSKSGRQTKLYLQAAGKAQDSVTIKAAGNHTFSLNYIPRQEGRFVYTLFTKSEDRSDTVGQVPVQVQAPQKLAVLLLSASPLFEFKFLKNHLGQLQHKVALRSTVSKGISQNEWINMPQTDLGRITPKLLQQFDIVITEAQALQEFNSSEKAALQRAVNDNGLGVLTIASEQPSDRTTAFFTSFPSKRLSQQETRNARATWANQTTTVPALPYTLTGTETVTGLIGEQGNYLLAASKKAGWGTVALTVIPQTFSWQLEGKQSTYATYWAHLLSAVAKKEEQEKFWQLAKPQAPQVHKPVMLSLTDYTLETQQEAPEATIRSINDTTSVNIALAQTVHQPEVFNGIFWPKQTGWHVVESEDVKPFYFFVQDVKAWPHQAILARQQATQQFVQQQSIKPTTMASTAYTNEPVPIIWFFILFVLSSGFLWLEEKL
nr:hypothetical protein [Pontibacter vulgaris]